MVELRQLHLFIGVAEALHFGRAAERLFLTQPALSRQIQHLERELGVQLFTRAGHRVQLTHAGTTLLEHARRLLADVAQAETAARDAARGVIGRLRVGFVSPAVYSVLPAIFRAFRRTAPGVGLELRQMSTGAQVGALRTGQLDVGFVHTPVDGASDFALHPVVTQPLVAALPAGHLLVRRRAMAAPARQGRASRMISGRPLAVDSLAEEPFILFPREVGSGLYDRIIAVCHNAGFTPRVVQEAEQMQTIVSLVAAELGVAIVPASIARAWHDDVVYARLRGVEACAELAAAWRRDAGNPVLPLFVDAIRVVADGTAGRVAGRTGTRTRSREAKS